MCGPARKASISGLTPLPTFFIFPMEAFGGWAASLQVVKAMPEPYIRWTCLTPSKILCCRPALPYGRASVSGKCSIVGVHQTRRRDRKGALVGVHFHICPCAPAHSNRNGDAARWKRALRALRSGGGGRVVTSAGLRLRLSGRRTPTAPAETHQLRKRHSW